MKKNKILFIGYFIFFLLIMFLSPISGDDWGNYIVGSSGLHKAVGNAIGMYFSWEGRFVSRLLINLLTYHKVVWNIINSIVIVSIIYLINNICNFKNKKTMLLLMFLSILLMNVFTFSQVIVWIAGNITYLFVIPLILIYIKLLYNKKDFNNRITIFIILLNIIIPMFVEHMAIILILLNFIFLLIDYLKYKCVNKKMLVFLLISVISFLLMFLSPGNRLRSEMENLEFNKLNFIDKLIYNIPNFVLYTYIINYFLMFITLIGSYFLIKNNIKNKRNRIILYIYELMSVVFVINCLLVSFNIINVNILNEKNVFVIGYYLLLTVINFYLLFKNSKNSKNSKNYLSILFYLIGIASNAVMLMSPTWGYRTSFATYLFMCISFAIVIDEYLKENKFVNISLILMNSVCILFYIVFYVNINCLYKDNLNIINEGIENNKNEIEIIGYPSFAPCNINPSNEYHLTKFKEYYGIKKEVEIKIIDNHWKLIFYYK